MKCRSETQETQQEKSGQEPGKPSSYEKPELQNFGELHALIRGSRGSGPDNDGEAETFDPD